MGINSSKPLWQLQQLNGNPEHDLFRSVITEYTDIAGISIIYYIRVPERENDYLYGEGLASKYLTGIKTKLIYEPTVDEATLTTGYGINSEEVISWASIPKFTFSRDVSAGYHPKPGDCLIVEYSNRAYEIADVHEEEKIFQLKKLIWAFVLKPYRFSDESDSAKEIARFTREPTDTNLVNDTVSEPLTAFGDNENLEEESEDIFKYGGDYDSKVFGF